MQLRDLWQKKLVRAPGRQETAPPPVQFSECAVSVKAEDWGSGRIGKPETIQKRVRGNGASLECEPIDPQKSRSPSLFDSRNRLVISDSWGVPEWHISNWNRHIVNGWSLSSIFTLQ